jgi:hypothetical protein
MAKGQQRSNREPRKPKKEKEKEKASAKPATPFGSQVRQAEDRNAPRKSKG